MQRAPRAHAVPAGDQALSRTKNVRSYRILAWLSCTTCILPNPFLDTHYKGGRVYEFTKKTVYEKIPEQSRKLRFSHTLPNITNRLDIPEITISFPVTSLQNVLFIYGSTMGQN